MDGIPKIMIIDDDRGLLNELAEFMTLNGYEVTTADNGKSALCLIPKLKPDLVLLDLNMDKVSGFQVADHLKSSPRTENIPVIAMTGYFSDEDFTMITSACRVKKCLEKPFSPDELLNEVKSVLFQ